MALNYTVPYNRSCSSMCSVVGTKCMQGCLQGTSDPLAEEGARKAEEGDGGGFIDKQRMNAVGRRNMLSRSAAAGRTGSRLIPHTHNLLMSKRDLLMSKRDLLTTCVMRTISHIYASYHTLLPIRLLVCIWPHARARNTSLTHLQNKTKPT